MFSDVWSENAAIFERLMEIHSNPSILYTMALIEYYSALAVEMKNDGIQYIFPECFYHRKLIDF